MIMSTLNDVYHAIAWTWGDRSPGSGLGYAITSGPLPDLTMLAIFGAFWRKHNCHVHKCPRLIWKVTAAGDLVCRKHHPVGQKVAEVVDAEHAEAEMVAGKMRLRP